MTETRQKTGVSALPEGMSYLLPSVLGIFGLWEQVSAVATYLWNKIHLFGVSIILLFFEDDVAGSATPSASGLEYGISAMISGRKSCKR